MARRRQRRQWAGYQCGDEQSRWRRRRQRGEPLRRRPIQPGGCCARGQYIDKRAQLRQHISAGSTNTQTATVTNIGNAPLSFTTPASGQNPSVPTGFTLDSSSSCPQLSAGSPASTLASGADCTLVIDFVPAAAGTVSGTASIADNDLNANAVQTVQLSGSAQTVVTTTTINVATPIAGQTQVSATILATTGTAIPAGSVVFTVDGARSAGGGAQRFRGGHAVFGGLKFAGGGVAYHRCRRIRAAPSTSAIAMPPVFSRWVRRRHRASRLRPAPARSP